MVIVTNLPAHLHGRAHDHVWLIVRLALGLALVLPALFHREHTQLFRVSNVFRCHSDVSTHHDGLRGSNGGRADCVVLFLNGAVEQPCNHGDATCVQLCLVHYFVVEEENHLRFWMSALTGYSS